MPIQTYRLEHGALKVLAINDGNLFMGPSRIFFHGASPDELESTLSKYALPSHGLNLACTCLLVDKPKYRLLVDCGAGDNARYPDLGNLMDGLAQEGIEASSIDYVVLSHGHFDHVVGATNPAGMPNFPKARYLMAQKEWQYWAIEASPELIHPRTRQSLLSIRDYLDLVDDNAEIDEGLRFIATPGHTFNHCSFEITWGDETLICPVDCFDHHYQIEFPQWGAEWDKNHQQSIESRQKIIALALEKDALVHSYHFEFPGFGKIKREGDTCLWEVQK